MYLAEVECNYSTDEMSDLVKYSFLDKGRNYTISNGITVYNSDTDLLFYIFPVFDGSVCAALIHYDGNGNYTLSSNVSVYDAVLNLEPGNISFIFQNRYIMRKVKIRLLNSARPDMISSLLTAMPIWNSMKSLIHLP